MGAFGTGLLAAFVATPCTGPFMGAALGAALILPASQAVALFAALGTGLGLPFALLGFSQGLRRLLPRPGRWMETFRRTMAVPMALTALALAWLAWRQGGALFASCAIAGSLLAVLAVALMQKRALRQTHYTAGAVFAALGAAAVFALLPRAVSPPAERAEAGMLAAVPYSAQALDEARAQGPVFVWFTADWCVTCKVNENVAIEREETRDAFRNADVTVIRGDWTRPDPAITRYLESKGAAGVPLYVWIDDEGTERVLDQVLGPDTLIDLAKAEARRGNSR
jgi:thiol:disulfide interchange protein